MMIWLVYGLCGFVVWGQASPEVTLYDRLVLIDGEVLVGRVEETDDEAVMFRVINEADHIEYLQRVLRKHIKTIERAPDAADSNTAENETPGDDEFQIAGAEESLPADLEAYLAGILERVGGPKSGDGSEADGVAAESSL